MIPKHQTFLFFLLLFIVQIITQQTNKCCQKFDSTNLYCLKCQDNTFLSGNSCGINIHGCKKHADCINCAQCVTGFRLVQKQFNNIKISKCQQTTIYTQIDVKNPSKQGQMGEGFVIVDDFVRSAFVQLKQVQALSCLHIKFQNGTQFINIEYQNPSESQSSNKRFTKVSTLIDLKKFTFNDPQIKPLKKQQLRKKGQHGQPQTPPSQINKNLTINTKDTTGTTTSKPNSQQKLIFIQAQENQQFIQTINLIAQGNKKIYKSMLQAKIIINIDGSQFIEIKFVRQDNGVQVVTLDVGNKRVGKINGRSVWGVDPIEKPDPVVPVDNNSTKNNNTNNNSNTNINNTSTNNTNTKNITNNTNTNTNNTKPNNNTNIRNNTNNNNNTNTTNNNTNINNIAKNNTNTTNNNTNTNTTNTNNNTNTNTKPNNNKNNNRLIQSIQAQSPGFTRLSQTQLASDQTYQRVLAVVKQIDQQVTKDDNFIGAFVRGASFTRYYKVYYLARFRVFEAHVAVDRLKNRVYVIGFNQIYV